MDLAVGEAHRHRIERPAFLVRIHAQRHRGTAAKGSKEVVVRSGPRVGATHRGRLIRQERKAVRENVGAETLFSADDRNAFRSIHQKIGLRTRRKIATYIPIGPRGDDLRCVSRIRVVGDEMVGRVERDETLRMPGMREDLRRVLHANRVVDRRMKHEQRTTKRLNRPIKLHRLDVL